MSSFNSTKTLSKPFDKLWTFREIGGRRRLRNGSQDEPACRTHRVFASLLTRSIVLFRA